MKKTTKTTITLISIFLLAGGAFFVYATDRLKNITDKLGNIRAKEPIEKEPETKKYVPGNKIEDFPLQKGKPSRKDYVKVLQKYINIKIWGISNSNSKFIKSDGIFGQKTEDALTKYLGIDPVISENEWKKMLKKVQEVESTKPNFF